MKTTFEYLLDNATQFLPWGGVNIIFFSIKTL